MKLNRATHDPGQLLEFYEEGLTALGALCERTWHDRLEVVAEGRRDELDAFRAALHDAGLAGFIRDEQVSWADAKNETRGFEIIR